MPPGIPDGRCGHPGITVDLWGAPGHCPFAKGSQLLLAGWHALQTLLAWGIVRGDNHCQNPGAEASQTSAPFFWTGLKYSTMFPWPQTLLSMSQRAMVSWRPFPPSCEHCFGSNKLCPIWKARSKKQTLGSQNIYFHTATPES